MGLFTAGGPGPASVPRKYFVSRRSLVFRCNISVFRTKFVMYFIANDTQPNQRLKGWGGFGLNVLKQTHFLIFY